MPQANLAALDTINPAKAVPEKSIQILCLQEAWK